MIGKPTGPDSVPRHGHPARRRVSGGRAPATHTSQSLVNCSLVSRPACTSVAVASAGP